MLDKIQVLGRLFVVTTVHFFSKELMLPPELQVFLSAKYSHLNATKESRELRDLWMCSMHLMECGCTWLLPCRGR
jgi:hypothetical protein